MTKLPLILLPIKESSDHPPPGWWFPIFLPIDMEFKELRLFPFALQIYLGTGMLRQSLDARPEVMAEILNQVEASPSGPSWGWFCLNHCLCQLRQGLSTDLLLTVLGLGSEIRGPAWVDAVRVFLLHRWSLPCCVLTRQRGTCLFLKGP